MTFQKFHDYKLIIFFESRNYKVETLAEHQDILPQPQTHNQSNHTYLRKISVWPPFTPKRLTTAQLQQAKAPHA